VLSSLVGLVGGIIVGRSPARPVLVLPAVRAWPAVHAIRHVLALLFWAASPCAPCLLLLLLLLLLLQWLTQACTLMEEWQKPVPELPTSHTTAAKASGLASSVVWGSALCLSDPQQPRTAQVRLDCSAGCWPQVGPDLPVERSNGNVACCSRRALWQCH
jgi:hypothetical protein